MPIPLSVGHSEVRSDFVQPGLLVEEVLIWWPSPGVHSPLYTQGRFEGEASYGFEAG
jgi:hypothetical protein